jgi:nitroreductase
MEFEQLLLARWSPRRYTREPLPSALVARIFDAARWAQSNWNEQPWRFLLATRDDGELRARLESYLTDGNAPTREGWLLGLACAKRTVSRDGSWNEAAEYDLGAACQMVALRAFDLGVHTRFMGGFDVERSRELCPDDYKPMVMFVMGYAAPDALQGGPGDRRRRALDDVVFQGAWGRPLARE